MTRYTDIIYKNENKDYDYKLCEYIYNSYFKDVNGSLLDIGCGNGRHLTHFENLGMKNVYGIDSRIEDNTKKNIKKCDVETDKFPFKSNSFRCVFSKSLIEHLHRPDNFIEETLRVMKLDGVLVLMTPDWRSQMSFFWDDYSHYHAYTKKSLKDLLDIFGYRDVECEYFYQLPFVWDRPCLEIIPKIISICPQSFKWKTKDMRNGEDRKLIRFSKEKMLLATGLK